MQTETYQLMCNSLTNQCLIQTPDYHPIALSADCLSGCVSGISPVLKLGHRVFVDTNTIQQLKLKPRQILPDHSSTTKTIRRNTCGVLNRPRFMVAVPLEAE